MKLLLLANALAAGVFRRRGLQPLLSLLLLVLMLIIESNLLEGGNLLLVNALKKKPMNGMNTR